MTDTRSGRKVAQGHKASFCLEDTKCDKGIEKTWNCKNGGDQGLSPNCHDIYSWRIDCQWIDISDTSAGVFTLRVNVNPKQQVPESDFLNNIAICKVYNYGSFAISASCRYSKSSEENRNLNLAI